MKVLYILHKVTGEPDWVNPPDISCFLSMTVSGTSILFVLSLSKINLSSQWRQSVTMQLQLMTLFSTSFSWDELNIKLSEASDTHCPWETAQSLTSLLMQYSQHCILSDLCPSFCLLMKLPGTPNTATKSSSRPLCSETKSAVTMISFLNVCPRFSASAFSNRGS